MIDELLAGLFDGVVAAADIPSSRRSKLRQGLGTELTVVAILGGVLCGLMVLLAGTDTILAGFQWLILPASVPVAWCIARGRGLLRGLIASAVSATCAFLVVGVYLFFKVLEFFAIFGGSA